MPTYRMTWQMDIVTAARPRDAAEVALDTIREPDTTATVFDVFQTTATAPPPAWIFWRRTRMTRTIGAALYAVDPTNGKRP
jgi:hypothetical protein